MCRKEDGKGINQSVHSNGVSIVDWGDLYKSYEKKARLAIA